MLLPLSLLALGLVALYFSIPFTVNLLDRAVVVNQTPARQSEEALPPPPREEFGFYNILIEEQPQLFDREQPVEIERQPLYFLLIEYFLSYDQAMSRSQDIARLNIEPIAVEPYVREGEIRFRLRLGPYDSRSETNAVRDILYDNDLPHRVIVQEKD